MKKLFIFMLFMILVVGFVHAESNNSGSGNDDTPECVLDSDCDADELCISGECEDNDSTGSGSTDSCTVDSDCDSDELCISGECEDSFDDNSTDDDSDDVCACPVGYTQEGEVCYPQCHYSTPRCNAPAVKCDDSDRDPPIIVPNPSIGPAPTFSCAVDPELQKEFNDLVKKLREKSTNTAADVDLTELKQKLARLIIKMREAKMNCKNDTTNNTFSGTGVAVGIRCQVPADLQNELSKALDAYKKLLETQESGAADVDLDSAKKRINELTVKISNYRRSCASDIVPGQCTVPDEYFKELEKLYKEYRDLEKSAQASGERIELVKRMINDYENKIKDIKSKCTKLNIDKDVQAADLSEYYSGKFSEISEIADTDTQLEKLKDLRKEIDETIKDLIQQKKKLKFEDLSGMVDEVTVNADSIDVGDTSTDSTDVEIETEVEGEAVSVSTTDDSVVIEQDGLSVDTDSVEINKDGLSLDGTSVKVAPNKLLEVKSLEKNRERITGLKLEKREDKIYYRAEFEAKKRVLGFIPATATQSVEIDAETGVVVEDKPWWASISSDAK
jgi:hypothetical protein